jgi:excisionase family DNA binding protein
VLKTNHLNLNDFLKSGCGYNSIMELLTIKQVAEELGLSENRVREFCQEGRLGEKVGHQWIITRAELEDFKKIPRERGNPRKNTKV